MNAEIETYSKHIRKQIADIQAALNGLSEEQLNRRPEVTGANSGYVIATHVFGNARAWVLGIACGQELRRDRPAEFASRGTYAELRRAADALSGEIDEALGALDPSLLDERPEPSGVLWGEGEPYEVSRREALAHVLEHASMHLGQLQLTRDLIVAESAQLKFTKMQGTGNDFLFVESKDDGRDWAALSRAMCDRHLGVGADGLMVVLPSERADVRMRLFNADGSEAEVSGNGVRCLVKYAIERGLATPVAGRVTIEAIHGVLDAEAIVNDGGVSAVRLSMGPPRFAPQEVPVLAEMEPVIDFPLDFDGQRLAVTCLSMGNPHAVLFVDEPVESYPLETIGPKIERHPAFPERVNFGVAHVSAPERMDVRVWERGVGETLACGSGSCAAAVAARLHGYVGDWVVVQQPGGELTVEWDGKGDVFLIGPAEFVFDGERRES